MRYPPEETAPKHRRILEEAGRLFRFLWVRPGLVRRTLPHYLAFFLPGFHPWKIDDRALLERTERELALA